MQTQTQTPTPKYQGDPSVQALANGLGTLGRYGDEYMVHAAHGETVIPAEIFESNPELKQQLFQQMRLMGIKDPNRYVVGNSLNSINPLTGQPEFFFKKIFRAIRRVVKKIAPIVVPIIGNMIAPGIGGPIASALYSKATGGSWGDALKSAALSYGASALGSGVKGIMNTGTASGFFSGLKSGALAPFNAASNLFTSGANNPLAQGIFGQRGAGLIFGSTAGSGPGGVGTYSSEGLFGKGYEGLNKAANAIFPSYQTFSGGQTSLGNNAVTAEQQAASQKSGYDYSAKNPTQPIGSDSGGGGGVDVNNAAVKLSPIDGVKGGSNAQYASGTYDPATAMTPGENAVRGAFTPESGYTDIAGATTNAVGDAVTTNAATGTSKLGNAYDWIKRNKYLVGAAGAAGLYYLSESEEDPMPDRDEMLAMTDPERLAYEQFGQLSPEEKRGQRGHELLSQSGIRPRYSPTDLARITGIGLDNATNFQTNTFGTTGTSMNAAQGGVANFALGGGGRMEPNGIGSLSSLSSRGDGFFGKLFTNPELFRSVLRNNNETQEKAPVIEAEGEVISTGPIQPMAEMGTLTTGRDDLNSANQATLQQSGEGAPFVFQNTAYIASSSGPVLQGADRTQQPVTTLPMGGPGGGPTGGGNPMFTAMMEQAKNAMDNRQAANQPVIAPLYQQSNEPLLTKRVNPNNIQGGLRAVNQLGTPNNNKPLNIIAPANNGLSSFYKKANPGMMGGGEVEGPGTGTSDSIPANLSDGEFVMTAEAVRNAGGGDRNMGAARMYDLMNRFEGGRA